MAWWWTWAWSLLGCGILYGWNRRTHIFSWPLRQSLPLFAVFVVLYALLGSLTLPRDTPIPAAPPQIIETHLDAWNVAWYDTRTNEIVIDDRLHADPAVYEAVLAHEMRHYTGQDAFQDLYDWRIPHRALARIKPFSVLGVGGVVPFQTRPTFEWDFVACVQLGVLIVLVVLLVQKRRQARRRTVP